MGQLVAREIEKAGGVAKEFNAIAVDDGIAIGHVSPEARNRIVSHALRAYAAMTTSAATGAVRDVSQVEK